MLALDLNKGRRLQPPADLVFERAIQAIRGAIERMAGSVPPPITVHISDRRQYRCREASFQQALVLKSVRSYSALLALRTLLNAGLLLDAGATMRILDEVGSDIMFLAAPLIFRKQPEESHHRFLAEFFQEEFDHKDPLKSTQKRDRVPRRKIRAYVARTYDTGSNASDVVDMFQTIESTFSGYIHGAAVHILDLYDGARFCVPMMPGDDPLEALREQRNYYAFRALAAVSTAAKALGDDGLFERLYELSNELFDESGEDRPPT